MNNHLKVSLSCIFRATMASALMLVSATSHAQTSGGTGGYGDGTVVGGAGGLSSVVSAGGDGGVGGQDPSGSYGNGGGGGGAGISGGAGGAGGNGVGSSTGGVGGAGGAANGGNGAAGADSSYPTANGGGGGGGGGGGAGIVVSTTSANSGTIAGGAGGAGGNSLGSGAYIAGGGGGGAGGYGAIVNTAVTYTNSGSITGGAGGAGGDGYGVGGGGAGGIGVYLGSNADLINSGSITGGDGGIGGTNGVSGSGVYVASGSTSQITNTGSIVGGVGSFGISNAGTIITLNNSQGAGNVNGALTYTGALPTNYNVAISSSSNYGKLAVTSGTGIMNFGIYNTSTLAKGTYASILSGVSSGNLGTTSGTYNGLAWHLALNSGTLWDLIVDVSGPNAANTLATVQQNASALSGVYNVQAAALQAGLTYDCNSFDKYGLCASLGGRATYGLTAPSGNQQAGLVVVSHKPDAHFRYGGFADQSVATASPNGIKYNNSGPMFGFFGYWNHQKDNMGWGASVTTAFSNSNLTVTRNASLANTEAGSGNTEMQGQAVQAQATYAMQATTRIKAQPYLGLRYYRVATGGYSEGSNASVTSPLTYNAMAQEVFAAVGGLGTSVFLAEKLTGNASVGIQQNLNYKMGNYQGTSSISGLESFSVSMPSNINSMATATAGVTYAIKKNEKLSLNALWQQQAFSATNTITALATYSIGF